MRSDLSASRSRRAACTAQQRSVSNEPAWPVTSSVPPLPHRPDRNGGPRRRRRVVVPRGSEAAGERRRCGARRRAGAARQHRRSRGGRARLCRHERRRPEGIRREVSKDGRPAGHDRGRHRPSCTWLLRAALQQEQRRSTRDGGSPRRRPRQRDRRGSDCGRLVERDAHCKPPESCWGHYENGMLVEGTPTTVDFFKTGAGAFRLVTIDSSYGGTGLTDIADWIRTGYLDEADVDQWYYSDPGIKPNSSHIKEALDYRLGQEPDLLFPVYDAVKAQGAGFTYHVIGFAVFHVTSWDIHGSVDSRINGYFMNMVWTGVPASSGGAPFFGARAVQLVE